MKEENIDGIWWIHGPGHPALFGTLQRAEGDELRLTVKISQATSFKEAIDAPIEPSKFPERVFGRDANDKPITLFGCFATHALSAGLVTYTIHVLAAVQGLEIATWSHQCVHAASVQVDLLHPWLGSKVMRAVKLADGKESWTEAAEEDLLFDIAKGVRLRIVRFIAPSWSTEEFKWTARPRIWFHFDKPVSLDDLTSHWIPWVARLLSLLAGAAAQHDELECYLADPYSDAAVGFPIEGKVIRTGKKLREPKSISTQSMFAPFPDVAQAMPDIIKKWCAVATRLEPVVDLFSTVTFHRTLYCEAQFLFLVQAIEVYHARSCDSTAVSPDEHRGRVKAVVDVTPPELREWVQSKLQSANFKYLDERLSEIFAKHSGEVDRLFKNPAALPERIRYTRNYLTHYTGSLGAPKYITETEMVEVNWGLRTLLWACLLKEIGISGNPIERLIRRNSDVHFVDLG